ncbi:MAG: acyltransferase family protein [Nocardioides sp.]
MSSTSAPGPAAPTRHARSTGSRDPFFDNAKLLLVMLVVIGHAWVLMPNAPSHFPAYTFLYAWHVPAFVIVTGYLSRSFRLTRSHVRRLMTTVAAPYLVFEALLALFRVVVGGESLGSDPLFLNPHWPMWYLAVLFLWRLATPLLLRVPQPMIVAVGISLLGGLIESSVLDVSRASGLLPFFVLGLTATRDQFDWLARPRVRVVAATALGLAFVVAVLVSEPLSNEWLYWRSSYDAMGVPLWQGLAGRLGMLVVAGLLALSALALIPRSQRWFTPLGAASLVVYLCHGFFVKGAQYAGVGSLVSSDEVTAFLLITGTAVLLALALSASPVARGLNKLVDPISTATEDTPGVLQPHHHRVAVEDRMALTHRHPTRQP